jgi:hypothetical protein
MGRWAFRHRRQPSLQRRVERFGAGHRLGSGLTVSLGDVGQAFDVLRPVRAIPAAGVIAVTAARPSQKPGGSFHG